jgi:hypothetical protein
MAWPEDPQRRGLDRWRPNECRCSRGCLTLRREELASGIKSAEETISVANFRDPRFRLVISLGKYNDYT